MSTSFSNLLHFPSKANVIFLRGMYRVAKHHVKQHLDNKGWSKEMEWKKNGGTCTDDHPGSSRYIQVCWCQTRTAISKIDSSTVGLLLFQLVEGKHVALRINKPPSLALVQTNAEWIEIKLNTPYSLAVGAFDIPGDPKVSVFLCQCIAMLQCFAKLAAWS